MGLMGSWHGFNFEVSPSVVRGFTGLTIKGGSETEDKVSEKQKYVERKNSSVTEISMSVGLNTYLGCNVRDEAIAFIDTAMEGASNYFYVGGKKLVCYKLMLTQAEIAETMIAPNGTWVSCRVNLTFRQCEKNGNLPPVSSGGSGEKGGTSTSKKKTVSDAATGSLEGGSTTGTDAKSGGLDRAYQGVMKTVGLAKVYSVTALGSGKPNLTMNAMR